LLETAFQNGTKVSVKLTDNFKEYRGQALITKMPITATFNKAYTYSITLLGVGALE
jgi:predicted secreted protein